MDDYREYIITQYNVYITQYDVLVVPALISFPSCTQESLRMKMACILFFFNIENRLYVVILIVGAFMGAEGKKHAETSVILFLCLIYCPEPEPSI